MLSSRVWNSAAAAFLQLEYEQVLAFLGIRQAASRTATYDRLARNLSSVAQDFWKRHPKLIADGIIHAGKFEAYFGLFRRWFLPMIHSRQTIGELLEARSYDERQVFWKRWNNRRWRLLFQVFFSRRLMGWLGRDPEFFRYVEGDVGQRFMERAQHGLAELPTHANPYLHYIVCGNFGTVLPRYLRSENFDIVRSGLDRLTLYHGAIEQAGKQYGTDGFDAFNLSDIFEYLDPEVARETYSELTTVAKPGARLAYWNTLVPRGCPEELAVRVRPLRDLSAALHERDLAFFYGAFHVDEVLG